MKRRERSAPIWLFSFVDLAFLLLIAFTQLVPDPEKTRAELAELDARANALRAERWSVILTGRNLGVSTKYSGVDPEASASNTDTRGGEEYFATPPLRYFTFRMNFSF